MRVKFVDCGPNIQDHWFAIKPEFPVAVDTNTEQAPTDLAVLLEGYDVCIIDHTRVSAEVMERCKARLRHIIYFGTGAASVVDLPVAERLGIQVHTIHGYGDTTVAEHAMALLQHEALRAGRWLKLRGVELRGKRLGIIGLGAIGQELARMATGFGLEVVAWSRSPVAGANWTNLELDELLASSDAVSLHLALNEQTRGFLSRDRLAALKPGAIIVNTARGALIDEAALVEALTSGQVGHAALDVFGTEPLRPDDPLVSTPNVTLTAHSGYWTLTSTQNQVRMVLAIVQRLQQTAVVA
jgi:D-3-phosphoglycerate dehydrogenase